jgi:DNA-binding beta-propeller fold protein YncE
VAAVLGDPLRRVSVLGGREGVPRSLGSVYGGLVTRLLGGSLRGNEPRVIDTPGVRSSSNGVAVSRDGSTLLVSDCDGGSHAIHEFNIADGVRRRVVGGPGSGPLQFQGPSQVWIADDDFVFVADHGNHRVQVLTPALDFHGFVGAGHLHGPAGVCANTDIVVAAEADVDRLSVFSRCDGALLHSFGSHGSGVGQLDMVLGVCFMSRDRHVAVAEYGNSRVSVFSIDGAFIRDLPSDACMYAAGVACSAFDELVVADMEDDRVGVCSADGALAMTMGEWRGDFRGVAIHGGAVFAHIWREEKCMVFT